MKKSIHFLLCKKYLKNLKEVEKICKENLEETLQKEIARLLSLKPYLPSCCKALFSYENFKLYKLRIKACGKGKSGGVRVIFGYDESKSLVLLILMYRKAKIGNLHDTEIIEAVLDCLENL